VHRVAVPYTELQAVSSRRAFPSTRVVPFLNFFYLISDPGLVNTTGLKFVPSEISVGWVCSSAMLHWKTGGVGLKAAPKSL
jgi:hypothetical protein